MANEARIKELKNKRGTIKGQITAFKNFLAKEKATPTHIDNITRRLELLKKIYEPFDSFSDELQLIDDDNTDEHLNARIEIQNSYLDLLDEADNLMRSLKSPNLPIRVDNNQVDVETLSSGGQSAREIPSPSPFATQRVTARRSKLPDTPIPVFSGEFDEWLPFKDSFNSIIDSRDDLSDIEKLQYLKGAMKGRAAGKLKSLTMIGTNYRRAWSLLEVAYADKRLIISKHLNAILNLPVLNRETVEGLQKLADDTTQNMESLASLGISITEEIIVQNLENKLPRNTAEKWEESQKRGEFPKLDDLIEFLYKRAARAERSDGEKLQNKNDVQKSNKRQKGKVSSQAFLTSTSGQKCPVCSEPHQLYRCKKFKEFSIPQRVEAAKRALVCFKCLRYHDGKDCKFQKCMICEREENMLLHEHQSIQRE